MATASNSPSANEVPDTLSDLSSSDSPNTRRPNSGTSSESDTRLSRRHSTCINVWRRRRLRGCVPSFLEKLHRIQQKRYDETVRALPFGAEFAPSVRYHSCPAHWQLLLDPDSALLGNVWWGGPRLRKHIPQELLWMLISEDKRRRSCYRIKAVIGATTSSFFKQYLEPNWAFDSKMHPTDDLRLKEYTGPRRGAFEFARAVTGPNRVLCVAFVYDNSPHHGEEYDYESSEDEKEPAPRLIKAQLEHGRAIAMGLLKNPYLLASEIKKVAQTHYLDYCARNCGGDCRGDCVGEEWQAVLENPLNKFDPWRARQTLGEAELLTKTFNKDLARIVLGYMYETGPVFVQAPKKTQRRKPGFRKLSWTASDSD